MAQTPQQNSLHDFDSIADRLAEVRYVVLPEFMSAPLARALRADADLRLSQSEFRAARIGRAESLKTETGIRSDEICWFEPAELSPAQADIWKLLEATRKALNERLFLGLHDFEAHYARYEPGKAYGKHIDRFSSDDARTLSVVLYLNENWSSADGGELKIYVSQTETVTVSPEAGKAVLFMSDGIEHEVLPSTTRTRLSIAVWFRRQKSPLT